MLLLPTLSTVLLSLLLSLPSLPVLAEATSSTSPVLAGPIGEHCTQGAKHIGNAKGTNLTVAGVPTYVIEPPTGGEGVKKVLLFFSDVYSPFYVNNQLLQDWFAEQGFHVMGPDYFLGDPIQAHDGEPGFNQAAWFAKSRKQAEDVLPPWLEAVRAKHGPEVKYSAVGYCFGGPYAIEAAATDQVVAAAFAHPASLTEDHFKNVKKPLLLSCAETDSSFPTQSRNRAVDILAQIKATYLVQVFSGVTHGFATRADPADPNAVWAKEESARSVAAWFNRFSV